MVKNITIASISLDGGALCLDFVNSVHERKNEPPPDYLHHAPDLVDWAVRTGIADTDKEKILKATIRQDPGQADRSFKAAKALRELLYRIFYRISEGKETTAEDLEAFSIHLRGLLTRLKLSKGSDGYERSWDLPESSLEWITAPILMDAYDLLLSDRHHRIKECPSCGWLFLDTTKNGKRKWCSMKACGSNVKALEWYHRNKSSK